MLAVHDSDNIVSVESYLREGAIGPKEGPFAELTHFTTGQKL